MPECKHEEISRLLAGEIEKQLYADRFPPVRELSARFQVSTRTMTKALKPLIKQGLIIPEGPRGCRVVPQNQQRQRTGFVGIFSNIGKIVPMDDPLIGPLLELVRRDNCTPLLTDVARSEMIRDKEFWRSSYLDGYIFVYSSFDLQLANLLKCEGIPFVAANRLPENYGAPWADFDHYPALCELYKQLQQNGSRRIALLDRPSFSNSIAYSSSIWQKIQDHWQVPPEFRCGTFGNPESNEDYADTLFRQLQNVGANGSMPDTVVVRSNRAGDMLKAIVKEKSLPVKVVMLSRDYCRPPYGALAEAVWELFKKVRDNTAGFSAHCEIPYELN